MGDYVTLSDVCRLEQQPAHIVGYAVRRFGPEPAARIGTTRVWRREDIPAIQAALAKTAPHSQLRERRETAVAAGSAAPTEAVAQ